MPRSIRMPARSILGRVHPSEFTRRFDLAVAAIASGIVLLVSALVLQGETETTQPASRAARPVLHAQR